MVIGQGFGRCARHAYTDWAMAGDVTKCKVPRIFLHIREFIVCIVISPCFSLRGSCLFAIFLVFVFEFGAQLFFGPLWAGGCTSKKVCEAAKGESQAGMFLPVQHAILVNFLDLVVRNLFGRSSALRRPRV